MFFKLFQTYLQACVQKMPEKKLFTGPCVNPGFNPVRKILTDTCITRFNILNRTCAQSVLTKSTDLTGICHKLCHCFRLLIYFMNFSLSTEINVLNSSNKYL